MSDVPAKYLLEDCFYALEQCSDLLNSAYLLHDHRQFSSGMVLAVFAREELGRSKILLDLLRKVLLSRQTVSIDQINEICNRHLEKHDWAQDRVTVGWGNDRVTELVKILHAVKPDEILHAVKSDGPESDPFKAAWKEQNQ
jgi:AbiV family abortive infection protein